MNPQNPLWRALWLMFFLAVCLPGVDAHAAGPRWVAGEQWTNAGKPMNWYRNDVQYFVDSGPLSPTVDHATAAALVDAAAAVWNVSGTSFTLNDGGSLLEDVSGSNIYFGTSGLVWPADVQSSNYAAKQIAVIFDADGSILDTLLGADASAPANCRENGVRESVDLFVQPGKIAHGLIFVNGRCTGTAPEQQLQLRYQLMRVFGRVIGLGWSQTNDNVFTGTPVPVYSQQMHWPIMHPIDIRCGPYTYQCLPQPFTLRDDDVSSLMLLYAAKLSTAVPGKLVFEGWLTFPNGQGMNGVNVIARRNYPWYGFGTEPYEDVSSVSGFLAPGEFGNPVTGAATSTRGTGGFSGGFGSGYFQLTAIPPLTVGDFTNLEIRTEAVNPLYVGDYAVGPYRLASVVPSGAGLSFEWGGLTPGAITTIGHRVIQDAAFVCNGSADGTESAPIALPTDGVWSGRLCGVSHVPWYGLAVRAGHTATVEVTATEESGAASAAKAMPVVALWHASDPTGTQPTLVRTPVALNSTLRGMTQLRASFATSEMLRLAIADQRGDGRPDYAFQARLLYADDVIPSRVGPAGGAIRILGTGFQGATTVLVGGVVATVTRFSPTEIDAVAPPLSSLGGAAGNDVEVADTHTGASTIIMGGLTYGGADGDVLALVTVAPSNVGVGASAEFAVRLTDASGKPAANASISFSASNSAVFAACGLASCTLLTDATGLVQAWVTPRAAGIVTLNAIAKSGSTVQASLTGTQVTRSISMVRPIEYVASGMTAVFHPGVMLVSSDAASAAQTVQWRSASPLIAIGDAQADGAGTSIRATGSLRDNEVATVQACAWISVCASQDVIGVAASDLRAVVVSGDNLAVSQADSLSPVSLRVTDTASHAIAGAVVSVYQKVTGWQPPCGGSGRCATPPVYGTVTSSAISDDDGLISVAPLQYAATAALTHITAAAGTSGTVTVTLQKTP